MKVKGYLLATAGALATAGGAQAADLPTKAPAYAPPVAAPSWTGFYVGVNVGANWQMNQASYGGVGSEVGSLPAGNVAGFIGGGQLGYNWQFDPNWVLGIEGTIQGLGGKKATAQAEFNTNKGNGFESHIDWIGTVRGRVGWLMHPDTMIYGTGGFAFAGLKASANPNGFASSSSPFFTTKSISKTKTGWVVGGGMEHMFTRNWTLGVEVLYHDFGTTTGYNGDSSKSTDFKSQVVTGTLKLNYKF